MCKCFNNLMANFNNLIKTGMSALNARHRIKSKFNKTLCDQFSKFTLSANFNVVILTRLQVKLFKGKKTFTTNSISKLCKIFYAWIIKQFKIFIHIIQVSQKFSINSLDVVNNVIFFGLKLSNSCISFQMYLVWKHNVSLILPLAKKKLL